MSDYQLEIVFISKVATVIVRFGSIRAADCG